ncbi:YhdP family protein [Frateuria aurantia]
MRLHWGHVHACGRGLRVTAIACTLVLAGLEIGGQMLLPLLAAHPHWVEEELSRVTHRQIRFRSLQGHWEISGPRFVMHDITARLAPGGTPLQLDEAILKLDFGGWMPGRHFINIYGRGLALDLSRLPDGSWRINGLGIAGRKGEQKTDFGKLQIGLWFEDLQINIADQVVGKSYTLEADALRLVRRGDEIRFGAHLHRPGARGRVTGAGVFATDGHQGRVWISADGVNLYSLLAGIDLNGYEAESGQGQGATWLDWKRGRIIRSVTRLDFTKLALSSASGRRSVVPSIHGQADLQQVRNGYALRWKGDDGSLAQGQVAVSDGHLVAARVRASHLDLTPLVPWVALARGLPAGLADWLGEGSPTGLLTDASFDWSQAGGLSRAYVQFQGLGIRAFGAEPGVDALRGELRADHDAVSLQLPAQSVTLAVPSLYPQPLHLDRLTASAAAWRDDLGWHLGLDDLGLAGIGFAGQLQGGVDLPGRGQGAVVDLYASIGSMSIDTAKRLLPMKMSAHARDWVQRSLQSGQLDDISALIHGNLADWPFRGHEGRFEAHARVDGAVLDYGKSWPEVTGLGADLAFVNDGLHVDVDSATSMGLKVTAATVDIPTFKDATLGLQLQAASKASDALDFVAHSPVASKQADVLSRLQLDGTIQVGLNLSMPLKQHDNFTLEGQGQWSSGAFRAPGWKVAIDGLSGPLHFDRAGFSAGPMQATFHGEPASLNVAIAGATGVQGTELAATLDGRFRIDELTQGYPELDWLNPLLQGTSPYRIGFDIHHDESGALAQVLHLESDLQGTALQLPAPLHKPAAAVLPLKVDLTLPVQGGQVDLSLGRLLQGRLRLPSDTAPDLAGTLRLGAQPPGPLPSKGLRILGHAGMLDATGWAQFVAAGQGGHGPGLDGVDVSSTDASLFGGHFRGLRIKVRPEPQQMQIDLAAPAIAGTVMVPTQDLDKRGLTMRLQRLYWPHVDLGSAGSDAAAVGSAAADGSSPEAAQAADNRGANPSTMPPLHLWIKDLRLGAAQLGEAQLEAWHVPGGLHIDPLRTLAPGVQISGTGDWLGDAERNHSHLKVRFAARNLGDMLAALGYPHIFDGGATRADLDAVWPGSPLTPDLGRADGQLAVDIKNGSLPALPPGAGARVLGLVSIFELPRRLNFNFSDVFSKGLGFDAIKGHFTLADGQASSQDLRIDGPAANIKIQGRAGLVDRDYDEFITVTPHVGNGLPVVGAVFGPIGIVAGVVAQGIFGTQINEAMIRQYRLTGSWDKPVFKPLEASPDDADTGPAAPPAAPARQP